MIASPARSDADGGPFVPGQPSARIPKYYAVKRQLLELTKMLAPGTPVEWAQSRYRGDRYKLVTRLHRGTRSPGSRGQGST